jgi:hypothetical protein
VTQKLSTTHKRMNGAEHSSDYADPMAAINDARARQDELERAEKALEDARAARDVAVWRAAREGSRPSAIARALAGRVSTSRVRQIVTLRNALERP